MTDHSHDYASNPANLTHHRCCRDRLTALCGYDLTSRQHLPGEAVDCPPCLEFAGTPKRCPQGRMCPPLAIIGRLWAKVRERQ